jgi:hypothetical protein
MRIDARLLKMFIARPGQGGWRGSATRSPGDHHDLAACALFSFRSAQCALFLLEDVSGLICLFLLGSPGSQAAQPDAVRSTTVYLRVGGSNYPLYGSSDSPDLTVRCHKAHVVLPRA